MRRDHWSEDANCKGMPLEVFFPKSQDDDRFDLAVATCKPCTVKSQCLKLVINLEEHDDRWGVFGGETPSERRKNRAIRRKQAKRDR